MLNEVIDNSQYIISSELGILHHISKLARLNGDPLMTNYGTWPCDIKFLNGANFMGNSAGCGFDWMDSYLGTIGETLERYCASFVNKYDLELCTYKQVKAKSILPSEFSLFHESQYKQSNFPYKKYTEDLPLLNTTAFDIVEGHEVLVPAQFVYLPFSLDSDYITMGTSTGLAAHTDFYKSILIGLYECIERDSFSITWYQSINPPKIIISPEIQNFIDSHFRISYEWHFFNVSYDLKVPSILGFCFGKSEFGDFIAVGSATRFTYGEALVKVIKEIGQAIPFFRYLLNENPNPDYLKDFSLINDFDKHAIFYTYRKDLSCTFDYYKNAKPVFYVDINEVSDKLPINQLQEICKLFEEKKYNILVKDITTCDTEKLGFYATKVFCPQLIPLSGSYSSYFLGGRRLYSVPKIFGYNSFDYAELNKNPHPFP